MKFINKLFIVLAGVTAFTFASCSDDDDYAPGAATNPDGLNVYFDATNNSAVSLGPNDTEFTFTVSRNKTDKAVTVPFSVSEVNAHLFTLPQQVEFAAGESSKNITVKVSDEIEMFIAYSFSIALDPSFTTPYEETEVYPRLELSIVKEDYAPYATGTYSSEFMGDEDGNPMVTDNITMEYSEILGNYRLKDCWGAGTGSVVFTWDGAQAVELSSVVFKIEDPQYGPISPLGTEEACTYDADSKTFTFPLEWTVSEGSFGEYPDSFTIEEIF